MKIAFVSSEVVPYSKTGGLGDISGSLPKELEKLGHDVKVFTPKYISIDENKFGLEYNSKIGEFGVRVAGIVRKVYHHTAVLPGSDVQVNFIDCPNYFHRSAIYTNDFDEDERFILFSKAVIELCQRLGWSPDVVHCNDWQTALIPLYLRDNYSWDRMFDKTATIFTIHNVGYQGQFGPETADRAELRGDFVQPGGPAERFGGVNFLKAGILFSDIITTVSETYSTELLTSEYGGGMESILRLRRNDFYGVLNGVDYDIWNPETDSHIPFKYNIEEMRGKKENKKFLLKQFGMGYNENVPLIGIVSRLVKHKGFDLIAQSLNEMLRYNAQWIVLGTGEQDYESLFHNLHMAAPHKFAFYHGFNNELAHLIEAAADIFVMPSRYEPCGLNQIYSLKYGTVPVVRKTGGLADTVQDWNEFNNYGLDIGNGFSFFDYSSFALSHAVSRAINDYHNKPVWTKIQRNGMIKDYSWRKSAEKYSDLYKKAVEKRS